MNKVDTGFVSLILGTITTSSAVQNAICLQFIIMAGSTRISHILSNIHGFFDRLLEILLVPTNVL